MKKSQTNSKKSKREKKLFQTDHKTTFGTGTVAACHDVL